MSDVAIRTEQAGLRSSGQYPHDVDHAVQNWHRHGLLARIFKSVALLSATMLLALLVLVGVEWLMRGSMPSMVQFFSLSHRPFWTTLVLLTLSLLLLDAVLGRLWQSVLLVAPLLFILAWSSQQKGMYLGDPIYPSDLLYTRQVIDLLPLLVRDRPLDALLIVIGIISGSAALIWLWRIWRKTMPHLSRGGRLARVAVAAPMLIWFGSISDYAQFSYLRDRLGIVPMMWDQKENYTHNGMVVAFIFNIPMANVSAPTGYSQERIDSVAEYLFPPEEVQPVQVALTQPQSRPDVIMIMSESFWDPTRLPGIRFDEDPIKTVRNHQSGEVFSPEFGGMTANVEFEALTGFSNAFLPYGSIPYQQYVRRPVPSLASFFRDQGYATRALHPYRQWFWNRSTVYQNFGFEQFLSEENLPTLTKRGNLASDEEFVSEIIRAAEGSEQPLFLFGVSLQGHGPYAPSRYPDSAIQVHSDHEPELDVQAKGTIRSFAQGAQDADQSLKRLMEWAKMRERETIIVFFGDHLPPLGPVYTETGFMRNRVASRIDTPDQMLLQHETPLMLWSSREDAVRSVGTISPSFLPYYVLNMAGLNHPYYTGFLRKLHDEYRVIDGHLLLDQAYKPVTGWLQQPTLPQMLQDYRQVQYDMLFGRAYAQKGFFPQVTDGLYSAGDTNTRATTAAGFLEGQQGAMPDISTQ